LQSLNLDLRISSSSLAAANQISSDYRWLKAGGVLVFVIPQLRLAKCARLLSEHFTDLRVFRLAEPACLEYKQIVVLATRRKRHSKVSDAVLLDGVRYLEANRRS
jgi:hypothetical protein